MEEKRKTLAERDNKDKENLTGREFVNKKMYGAGRAKMRKFEPVKNDISFKPLSDNIFQIQVGDRQFSVPSPEYVRQLEQQIETLTNEIRAVRQQLNALTNFVNNISKQMQSTTNTRRRRWE